MGCFPVSDALSTDKAAAAKIGDDADEHVRLVRWCEEHGLQAVLLKHLVIAVQILPDHAAARGLLGQMACAGRWRRPEDVASRGQGQEEQETLIRCRERRDAIADTAEAHWQLAGWCADQGIESEANVHLMAVVRIDPMHEEAWKKLGYQKENGRWMSAEQTAEERAEAEAQRKADDHWRRLLQKWKGWLGQKGRWAEAEKLLAGVDDHRAVPSIWKVFGRGKPSEQERAIDMLGHIKGEQPSRALAGLAVFGKTALVGRAAVETLTRRKPDDVLMS